MKQPKTKTIRRGAFGLTMGLSARDLGTALEMTAPFSFRAGAVPQPRPGFDIYQLMITPACGLSRVTSVGQFIPTDGDGAALRAAFDALETDLARAFGPGERLDGAAPGRSLAVGPSWTSALASGAWLLNTRWLAYSGATLDDGLESVVLAARAIKSEQGFLLLQYQFANIAEAEAELEDWPFRVRG